MIYKVTIMKAEELMTGDWVRISLSKTNLDSHKGKVAKVTELKSYPNWNSIKVTTGGLDEYYCERDDEIEPIPLTAEILEKNGFVSQKESYIAKQYIYACGGGPGHNLFVTVFKNRDFVKVYYYPIDTITMIDVNIPHCAVHQLQHALRLCGIEKEITL